LLPAKTFPELPVFIIRNINTKDMKTKMIIGAALLSIAGLTSCDNTARLAGNVEGTWHAPETNMILKKDHGGHYDSGAAGRHVNDRTLACAPTITFTRTQGTKGGDITIVANYTMTMPVALTDTVLSAPVNATVSGTANASGTWMAKDDDEIAVTLDATRTDVTVDPSSLTLSYATLTDSPAAGLEAIKARVQANVASAVSQAIRQSTARLHEFDDVKVAGSNMKLEIGKTKLMFTRQQ
jgi:hypothetical protein